MCILLKLHYPKFDISSLFCSKVIEGKPLRGRLPPPPLVKEGLKQANFSLLLNRLKMSHICHTIGFENINLIFHYSKSVSHENSKCVDFFVSTGETQFKTGHFFSHAKQNEKVSHI